MLSSLVITLREGIEGALAVAIVLLYLRKTGRHTMVPAVWWGLAAALLCSVAGAVLFRFLTFNNEIVEGVLMLLAAFFVGTMILWMWRSAKGLKKEIETKIETITSTETQGLSAQKLGIFLFTFLMILREGIETVIFLSAVTFTTDALLSFLGGILGLAMAVAFGVFFVRGSIRIDLGRFFKITGIVLLLFVFQLLIGGIHELGEGGLFDIGPREMSIVGPIVKNNALFLIGILLIPALMLLIPRKTSVVQHDQTQSAAEQRLQRAEQRKQNVWRFSAATLSLFIILFIAFDSVYGQNRKSLSTPTPVTAANGVIRIPIAEVSDGDLHRFILSGSS
ncbi:MAG TPA: FTR1 family protein, partial [Acidobacteriota bacterium]